MKLINEGKIFFDRILPMIGNPLKKITGLNNKKVLIIFLIFSVVLYLDYSFIIRLQFQNIRNTAPKIQKFKYDLSNLALQFSGMEQSRAKHLARQQKLLEEAKKVVSEGQVPSLLEEIANTAKNNGVELTQMKPSRQNSPAAKDKTAKTEKFTAILIKMDILCGYHELGHFINELENNPVFMAVEDLKITPQQKDYFKQKVELVLKTYVEK